MGNVLCRLALSLAVTLVAPAALAQEEPPASTDDQEARARFEAGRMAFGAGRFEDALADFERAYALSSRPQLLYNIAQCHDRLRHDEEAVAALRRYLEAVPDAPNRAEVERRLLVLEREIGTRTAVEPSGPSGPVEASRDQESSGGITTRWWFWTAVVAIVAGGVVAAIVLAPDADVEDPLEPPSGVVFTALRLP